MGYASRAMEQLTAYFEGKLASLREAALAPRAYSTLQPVKFEARHAQVKSVYPPPGHRRV